MIDTKVIRVPIGNVRSLVWRGEMLVDWVGGGRQLTFGGEVGHARVFYVYGFDTAVESPSGEFSDIYTRLGTKGLVLRRGEVLREINRSYYFADDYEYPIALNPPIPPIALDPIGRRCAIADAEGISIPEFS